MLLSTMYEDFYIYIFNFLFRKQKKLINIFSPLNLIIVEYPKTNYLIKPF